MRSQKIEVVPASRPDSKDEILVEIYNGLTERQRAAFSNGDLVECNACDAKSGTPTLCASCRANRYIIGILTPSQRRRLIKVLPK